MYRRAIGQQPAKHTVDGAAHGLTVHLARHVTGFDLVADVQYLMKYPVRRGPQHPLAGVAADKPGDIGVGQRRTVIDDPAQGVAAHGLHPVSYTHLSVFAIGEAGLLNALYDAGITMNDVNPDYVVVGEGRTYSLDTLTRAVNLVMAGAKLIGANSDVSGPIENGIAPACRALVAPIEMATGKQAYFCGKPNPCLLYTSSSSGRSGI